MFKCYLFGCNKFRFKDSKTKICISCGKEYIFVKFYPWNNGDWLEKSFVEYWKNYENLTSTNHVCGACGMKEDKNGECGCCSC
jgi:hypothetical protein